MTIYDNKAYIVVNNSHKIIVANRYTMEKIAEIDGTDINNPRFFVAKGNTGYVSNWGNSSNADDDFIAVINLETNEVTSTIPVGEGPEKMLIDNDKLYVNLQGGYSQNNKVEVIDTNSNTLSSTITVGDVPNSIVKDNDGAIWILCGGKPSWTGAETKGQLFKIVNDEVATTFDFTTTEHPSFLTLNDANLMYSLNGNVYATATSATELNTTAIDGLAGFYYAMTAHNGKLYATNAGDFASEGTLKVFDLTSNSELDTFTTGIIPGSVVFE